MQLDLKKFESLESEKAAIEKAYNAERSIWLRRATNINEVVCTYKMLSTQNIIHVDFTIEELGPGMFIHIKSVDFDGRIITDFNIPVDMFTSSTYAEECINYLKDQIIMADEIKRLEIQQREYQEWLRLNEIYGKKDN